jgi:hypothetical protein
VLADEVDLVDWVADDAFYSHDPGYGGNLNAFYSFNRTLKPWFYDSKEEKEERTQYYDHGYDGEKEFLAFHVSLL